MKVTVTKLIQMAYFAYREQVIPHNIRQSDLASPLRSITTALEVNELLWCSPLSRLDIFPPFSYIFFIINHCSPLSPFFEQTLFIFKQSDNLKMRCKCLTIIYSKWKRISKSFQLQMLFPNSLISKKCFACQINFHVTFYDT